MKIATYEGVVENGCVHVPTGVLLPEKAKVFVIVPEKETNKPARIMSPRLVDKSKANLFELEVSEESQNA